MLFNPSYKLNIIGEDEFSKEICAIEHNLEQYAIKGTLKSFDGNLIAYEYFLANNSKASIVLIHGFTEFYKKLYEMAWYFLNMGYNVFLYDQRGHGLSHRDVDNLQLTHINDFDEYVSDLEYLIDSVVRKATPTLPIYLFGHSMGGAVVSLYLAKHSDAIERAILSSPMVCPKTHGVPGALVKRAAASYARREGWNARFHQSYDFNPNPSFNHSSDASYARFKHNLDYRVKNERYQNSSFTNRWMTEALNVQKKLLNKDTTGKIKTKILIISAENDGVVHTRPQHTLSKLLPNSTIIVMPGAKHTVYTATGALLNSFYETVFNFLK